tara:strand:+ start:176 stop:634 length:459 start_codon:yes stop_codon:yes gene_type:complete
MHIAISNSKIDISSLRLTKKLAETFQNCLNKGSTACFYGEVGVGKTTFIKYLINAYQKKNNLKISEVTSPTFNLLNEYEVGDLLIKHYDFYRINNETEINNLGLLENNSDSITLIEWPELFNKNLQTNTVNLFFSYENDFNNRYVRISGLKY